MIDIKRIRKRITGSLACMIAIMMMIMPQAALAASSHQEMKGLAEPQGVSEVDAAAGIVRIQTGFNDEDGNFNAEHTFSGFVVSAAGNGGVYIATTWHHVDLGQNTVIHVIVKNDTAVDASVESYSDEQDFCILSAANLNRKQALPLRIAAYDQDKDALAKGDSVRALGFASKSSAGTEFSSTDVRENGGTIKSMEYEKKSATYISHTAEIRGGLDGGPLVDENGYVIGINNPKASDDDINCALLIQEADKLLDSSGIVHRTKDKDALYAELYGLCDKGIDAYKKVKKDYKSDLYDAVQEAIKVMSESPYNRSSLESAISGLQTAMDKAEYKSSKLLYLIIALGVIIAAMLVRLILLIVWNRKYEANNPGSTPAKKPKKEKKAKKEKPAKAPKPAAASAQKAAPDNAEKHNRVKPEKAMPQAASAAKQQVSSSIVIRNTGARYELKKNIVTIGRSREADVCIEGNDYVARMHAMIERRKGAYFIHDMGSKNGTYLNGQPVKDNGIRLISGDVITVANEEIDFI